MSEFRVGHRLVGDDVIGGEGGPVPLHDGRFGQVAPGTQEKRFFVVVV